MAENEKVDFGEKDDRTPGGDRTGFGVPARTSPAPPPVRTPPQKPYRPRRLRRVKRLPHIRRGNDSACLDLHPIRR
jgi:hypothetical protein